MLKQNKKKSRRKNKYIVSFLKSIRLRLMEHSAIEHPDEQTIDRERNVK